jgi:DNA-binding Lrp family transcriptional regulator
MSDLDRVDRVLLAALQENARQSNKELAARVGLAQSTVSERIRRLEQSGAIAGYHARVAPEAMSIGLEALIAVRLRRHGAGEVEAFRGRALSLPETAAVLHVTGGNDFLVHVVVRDATHLRDLAVSVFSSWPEVGHIETSLIFERVSKPGLPDLGA